MPNKYGETPEQKVNRALNQIMPNNSLFNKVDSGNEQQVNKEDISKIMVDLIDKFTLQDAINRLRQELQKGKEPGSYYYGWQSNIAMCFYDSYANCFPGDSKDARVMSHIHKIANEAAQNFLNILCTQQGNSTEPPKQSE